MGLPSAHRHEAKVTQGNFGDGTIVVADAGMIGAEIGLTVEHKPSLAPADADEGFGSRDRRRLERSNAVQVVDLTSYAGLARLCRGSRRGRIG